MLQTGEDLEGAARLAYAPAQGDEEARGKGGSGSISTTETPHGRLEMPARERGDAQRSVIAEEQHQELR